MTLSSGQTECFCSTVVLLDSDLVQRVFFNNHLSFCHFLPFLKDACSDTESSNADLCLADLKFVLISLTSTETLSFFKSSQLCFYSRAPLSGFRPVSRCCSARTPAALVGVRWLSCLVCCVFVLAGTCLNVKHVFLQRDACLMKLPAGPLDDPSGSETPTRDFLGLQQLQTDGATYARRNTCTSREPTHGAQNMYVQILTRTSTQFCRALTDGAAHHSPE